ncbi:hypothetical protein FACUT_10767 [Fusarium acutatum]|uniref:Uncharacterized protein n=1 Tax=Fusarium acutatum TaxID=78861 RepID=A0A8H4JF33_9HYPO|nr:hypothetical protein FACUT_10767 [Fusarium acutatum]
MKRPACEYDSSLEDTKNDSEKRPRMEQDQIGRHQPYPFRPATRPFIPPDGSGVARSRPPTPPLQHYDFPNVTNETLYWMDVPIPRTINNLRNHFPLSPATSCASTTVSDDVFPVTHSNLDSPPQSPIPSTTGFEEECLSIGPRSLFSKLTTRDPPSVSSQTNSESPSCAVLPEMSQFPASFEPNFTSAFAEKKIPRSNMSSEIKSSTLDRFEQQRLAIEKTVVPNPQERTRCWLMSSRTPDMSQHGSIETSPSYQAEEGYNALETLWEDASRSYIDDDPIRPKVDVQKPSEGGTMYTDMEIEPCNFGLSRSTIASLPECIRFRIMSFCTEPKDLISLINSSPVFLQSFCQNRRTIISQITRSMRFRFGGDMPRSCLIVARLRNVESKGAAGSLEIRKTTAKRAIKTILSFSPKGPLLHSVYSLRHLNFISDTLDKAESVMTGYVHQAWADRNGVRKLGPSHTAGDLVFFKTERKRFMDAICLYDAYCTAFFSENAISSDDDTALRQSFLEEDGIPGGIIKRFYSITTYLH